MQYRQSKRDEQIERDERDILDAIKNIECDDVLPEEPDAKFWRDFEQSDDE